MEYDEKKTNLSLRIAGLLVIILIASLTAIFLYSKSFSQKPEDSIEHHIAMDTDFSVRLVHNRKTDVGSIFSSVFTLLDSIEDAGIPNEYSRQCWIDQERVFLSGHSLSLTREALQWDSKSGGAFNPAIGTLTKLWDIPNKDHYIPPLDTIIIELNKVGAPEQRFIHSDTLYKDPSSAFDFGGIAKGYALDRIFERLMEFQSAGLIEEFIVDAGRSITGFREDSSFRIGITHPREDRLIASFQLPSGWSCSSCGDYERYFIEDGVRYHHILDPATGHPARQSVTTTVVGPSGTATDALSTAIFVLGPSRGLELLKNLDDFFGFVMYIPANFLTAGQTVADSMTSGSLEIKYSDGFDSELELELIKLEKR